MTSGARRGIPAVTERVNWWRSLAKEAAARKDRSCHLQFCSESV
jgi:hypothetical protein